MPVKKYKPTSAGIRFQSHHTFDEITKTKPEKSLTKGKPKTGGRNSIGRITSRFIGGGHKQKYRDIDFKRPHQFHSLRPRRRDQPRPGIDIVPARHSLLYDMSA